jgi:hypothetical protein
MTAISKASVWALVGIVGGGAAAGIGYAAVSAPASAGANSTTTAATTPAAHRPGLGVRLGRRGLLQRLEHGQLTLQTPRGGERTVDLQRGTVDAVSPTSITVVSPDHFTRTYAVRATTRVRGAHGRESIGDVHPGDTVLVVASRGAAVRILDRR